MHDSVVISDGKLLLDDAYQHLNEALSCVVIMISNDRGNSQVRWPCSNILEDIVTGKEMALAHYRSSRFT